MGLSETEWAQERVREAKDEIIEVIKRLMEDLPAGYIVTDCAVGIGRVDLMGGGSRVFIDHVNITVELAQPSIPPATAAP